MEAGTPFGRITVDPAQCGGKPCIRGMRITVRRVLELASYPSRASLLEEYPYMDDDDLQEALRYAAANLDEQTVALNQVA